MIKHAKFIAVITASILFLSALAPSAYALTGKFNYTSNETDNIQIENEFEYRDDCFQRSSFLGCSHLEILSAQVAIASASRYGDGIDKYEVDPSDNSSNVVDLLKEMEFKDVSTNKYYTLEKEENSAGVAVGHKTITVDNKDYTLLAIIPRSAGYKNEWAGNFTIEDGDIHFGFKAARDEILRYVNKYIKDNNIKGNLKVWTAGHSRGSALANMIGGFFAGGGIEYFGENVTITPEDVYCYTYATPRTIKDGADKNTELSVAANRTDGDYKNDTPGEEFSYTKGGTVDADSEIYGGIRNLISSSDIIAMLPPESWGFTCYGKEIPVDHDIVTEEAMLKELKEISTYAYNKYIKEGSPKTFERKTFDLKTLKIVKDNSTSSAMDINTFLKERIYGLTYNATTNKAYKDEGYQDVLKAVAGIYGMGLPLFDEDVDIDESSLIEPLIYSYLAYASERLQAEEKATNEDEAIALALEELLTYFTGEEIDNKTFTVDDFVVLFAKYIAENEDQPITDKVVSGIVGLIPAEYLGLLSAFKEFDKNYTSENDVTMESAIKEYIKACYLGPDPECSAAAYYSSPEQTRSILYTILYFALYSEHPEIMTVLMDETYAMNGNGKFQDLVSIILSSMKKGKDENGKDITYSNVSELADAELKIAVEKVSAQLVPKAGEIYGNEFEAKLEAHIESLKTNISKLRTVALYMLLYEDGGYSAERDVKNITTFIGNASIIPLAHYNEVYVAYAKAAKNFDVGYEDHKIEETKSEEEKTEESKEETPTETSEEISNPENKTNEAIKESTPKTGDNIGVWIVIAIASIIGMAVVIIIAKKK